MIILAPQARADVCHIRALTLLVRRQYAWALDNQSTENPATAVPASTLRYQTYLGLVGRLNKTKGSSKQ